MPIKGGACKLAHGKSRTLVVWTRQRNDWKDTAESTFLFWESWVSLTGEQSAYLYSRHLLAASCTHIMVWDIVRERKHGPGPLAFITWEDNMHVPWENQRSFKGKEPGPPPWICSLPGRSASGEYLVWGARWLPQPSMPCIFKAPCCCQRNQTGYHEPD